MSNLSEQDKATLKTVVDATTINSFVYLSAAVAAGLESAGYIVGNPAVVDADNNVAYRATEAGAMALFTAQQATPPAPPVPPAPVVPPAAPFVPPVMALQKPKAATPAASPFSIGQGFQRPVRKSRKVAGNPGAGRNYPFEQLELNGYFFVPATEKRPDPKKSMAGTISGANKRFKDHNPPRYFVTERATAGQVFGEIVAPSNGVYVIRVEPPVDAQPV